MTTPPLRALPFSPLWPWSFLALQALCIAVVPAWAAGTAYLSMLLAPLAAALACWQRGLSEGQGPARRSWWLLVLAMLLWAAGAFGNLWYEWVQGHANEMYLEPMLAFHLSVVPVSYLLATEWSAGLSSRVHGIDAALALALGLVAFRLTWVTLSATTPPMPEAVDTMVWLVTAQNSLIAVGALARWSAAVAPAERSLFAALSAHAGVYLVLVVVNNHFIAGDPRFGPEWGSAVTVAFLLLWGLASRRAGPRPAPRPPDALVRVVRSASPLVIAMMLLGVSLLLIRLDYLWGAAGVVVSVVGYAVRNLVAQISVGEQAEGQQREQAQLQLLAWTDAVTGVANRRFLDHALSGRWWREQPESRPGAVLMIAIDHFKQLGDRAGPTSGDACLRQVAAALQQALTRPGDLLARYDGEAFLVLLHEADAASALGVAEQMRLAVQTLQLPHPGSPHRVVTVSVGAASARLQATDDSARLVQSAEQALDRARCEGGNRVHGQDMGRSA